MVETNIESNLLKTISSLLIITAISSLHSSTTFKKINTRLLIRTPHINFLICKFAACFVFELIEKIMKGLKKNVELAIILIVAFAPLFATAQQKEKKRNHEFYFSWGYNEEWYTHSNVHISQPSLGNNFTFENIKGI